MGGARRIPVPDEQAAMNRRWWATPASMWCIAIVCLTVAAIIQVWK
jgi:hypothetical protein